MAGSVNAGSIIYEVDMDTGRLLAARREVDAALNGLSGSLGRIDASVTRTERSIASVGRTMSSLTNIAKGLAAALSIQQVAEYANSWVNVSNKLVNAVRPTEQLGDVTQRVFDISQKTMSSLEATAALYGRLERATRSAGTSTAELTTLVSTINKGLAVSGATTQEASSTMIQLSQALASGVLRGEEFNSISENGSRLAVALADSLGVTIGQLRAMAAQGKLTTEVVVNGLLKQSDQIAKEFSSTVLTMGQAFTVATNNITKFIGESSTTNTTLNVFNHSVITLSENLNTVSTAIGVFAVVMGSRFVGALTAATAARVTDIAAASKQSQAAAQAAEAAQIESAAQLRLAQANKSSAVSALNLAQAELNVMKATNAATVSTVAIADAQVISARATVQQLESEKLLEAQRLRAQITEQGRIATATRMAEIQMASSVATQRLAAAEAAAATQRATVIAAAEANLSAARTGLATATGTATAANAAYIASTEAAAAASAAATTTIGGLARGALSLIGGPAGAAVLAGVAIFYFYQKAQQAKQESIDFADKLDGLIGKMKEMSQIQLAAEIDKANKSIAVQNGQLSTNEATLAGLNVRLEAARKAVKDLGEDNLLYSGAVSNLNTLESESIQLTAQVERERNKLSQTISKTGILQAQANGTFAQGIDLLKRDGHEAGVAAGLFNQLGDALNVAAKAKDNFNSQSLRVGITKDGQKQLDQLTQENELLQITDKRLRAVKSARLDAINAGEGNQNVINQVGELAGANYDLQQAEAARNKAAKAGAKTEDEGAKKIADLQRQLEYLKLSYDENSREAAVYNAVQSAGSKATELQKKAIGEYAGALFDAKQKQADLNAAIAADPVRNADKTYSDASKQLKRQLDEGIVDQQQFNQESLKLAQDHANDIAKANANSVVTPAAEAAGTVDPVQQLANENAKKLALIQQYEANKTITEQQGIALRNAANTQYEQQRIAAQWQMFAAQTQTNQLIADTVDALGGSVTSSITGLISGTTDLQSAISSISNTILNELVGSFVKMGVEWVKSAIMGQTAQVAATAATTSAAVAGTATTTAASVSAATATTVAWTPAAIVASIGSFGGAAAIGIGAVIAAMALSSSIAGKRKNGGPVSAGSMYQVGEGGMPEIYQSSSGRQYMIPGDNGSVISNKDMQSGSGVSGSGINVNVNITNTNGSYIDQQVTSDGAGGVTVDVIVADLDNGGPISNALTRNTSATRRANA